MSLSKILGAGATGYALWRLLRDESSSMLGQIQPYIDPGQVIVPLPPPSVDVALSNYTAAMNELSYAWYQYYSGSSSSYVNEQNRQRMQAAEARAQEALRELQEAQGSERLPFKPTLPQKPTRGTVGELERALREVRQQVSGANQAEELAQRIAEEVARAPVASVDPGYTPRPYSAPPVSQEAILFTEPAGPIRPNIPTVDTGHIPRSIEYGSPGTPGVRPAVPTVDIYPYRQEPPTTLGPEEQALLTYPTEPIRPMTPTPGTLRPGQPLEVFSPQQPMAPAPAPSRPSVPTQDIFNIDRPQPPAQPFRPPTPTPGSRPLEVISPPMPLTPAGPADMVRPPVTTPGTPSDQAPFDDFLYSEPPPPQREPVATPGTRECPSGTTRDPYSQACLENVATPGGGMSVWDIINLGPSGANAPAPAPVSPGSFQGASTTLGGRSRAGMTRGPVHLKRALGGFHGGRSIFG